MNVPRGDAVRTRSSVIALTAASALVLGGCAFGGHSGSSSSSSAALYGGPVKKLNVSSPYTGNKTGQPGGTFTPAPDGKSVAVQDRPFSGDYSAALPRKVTVQKKPGSEKTFKLKRLAGTYFSSVDGTTFDNGTGQWTGLQLVRFTKRLLGVACVQFTATSTQNDKNATGTFALIGGTRFSKRTRFNGTFTQAAENSPTNTSPISGVTTGKLRFNRKPRAMNAECRALLPQLP